MAGDSKVSGVVTQLFASQAKNMIGAAGKRVLSSVTDKISGTTDRLTEYASGGGGPGLLSAVTGGGGGNGSKNTDLKVTNIVEQIDVGVPVRLAYDQWTRFTEFPDFMKKVENVKQESDEKLRWKAQVLWSHRSWESTIIEQVPDRRIVWRSEGAKGAVDGAVTFHELAPELTRVMMVLEYHPQGFFEKTGNIWRAQGRRARLELKHFARHAMTQAILHPEEVEGWRGEIHDGEVVKDQEAAQAEERERAEGQAEPQGDAEAGESEEGRPAGRGEREPGRRAPRDRAQQGDEARPEGRRGQREGGQRQGRREAPSARRSTGGTQERPARRPAPREDSAGRPSRRGREREDRGAA
jgi:hypothetical protein